MKDQILDLINDAHTRGIRGAEPVACYVLSRLNVGKGYTSARARDMEDWAMAKNAAWVQTYHPGS